jgi:hypothetical protein
MIRNPVFPLEKRVFFGDAGGFGFEGVISVLLSWLDSILFQYGSAMYHGIYYSTQKGQDE